MRALWGEAVSRGHIARDLGDQPVGDSCRLTVTHDELREGANDDLYGGWPMILSGLKTCSRPASSSRRPARSGTRTPRARGPRPTSEPAG